MAVAIVLFSVLTGALSAGVAAFVWEAGILGIALAYWLGGMAGAMALMLRAALLPDAGGECCGDARSARVTA
ncbi:hypothetical protein [Rhodovulum strictum]|uniref:Uncharacterized protein n=1 Tax=Rhodovulum strictum TaxID=58314 RepID=A0A844B4V2_9RHOB|nr:hypothetical protein [Rhodovulum strictum]MRH19374.1 hypothetical protein [Rhodovulum strictum]